MASFLIFYSFLLCFVGLSIAIFDAYQISNGAHWQTRFLSLDFLMLKMLTTFTLSRWYWLAVTAVGLCLEGVALFYQHVLGEPPCVLCIQARVWVLLGVVVGIVGAVFYRIRVVQLSAQVGLIVALGGLLNRSWIAVLVERGLYEGQCGMDPGFPAWFSLDTWFPQVFEVWTMCGYTPNFLFGFSMGEGLVFAAICLLLVALAALGLMVRAAVGKNK